MANGKIKINKCVYEYLDEISKKYKIKKAYLFGSYANGRASKYSDIDLAIISSDFNDKGHFEQIKYLYKTALKINPAVEALPFSMKEYARIDPRSFLAYIVKTGIPITLHNT